MRALPFQLGCVGASLVKRSDHFIVDLLLFESEQYQPICDLRIQLRLMNACQMQEQIDGLRSKNPVWNEPASEWDGLNRQKAERLVSHLSSPMWAFAGIDQINNLSVLYALGLTSKDRSFDQLILCDGSRQYRFYSPQVVGSKGNDLPKNVLNSFRASLWGGKSDWTLEPLKIYSTNHL